MKSNWAEGKGLGFRVRGKGASGLGFGVSCSEFRATGWY